MASFRDAFPLYEGLEIVPPISVSTNFKTPADLPWGDFDPMKPTHHLYSRYTQGIRTKVESDLSELMNGYALTYTNGLAASYAAFMHLNPKRIAITGGYHGVYLVIQKIEKVKGTKVPLIGIDDEFEEGDVLWLETPLNPTGEVRNIKYYAEKAHKKGIKVVVDATFGPPPLQDPFKWGADIVMHSGTKYLGGHSDLLCGVLVVKTEDEWRSIWHDRAHTGAVMGSLETWLLDRSLKTLHIRVKQQSETATKLADWLHQLSKVPEGQELDGVKGGIVEKVWHPSLQEKTAEFDPKEQMEGGWNATFAIQIGKAEWAGAIPYKLQRFIAATSLGAVESLIEQRQRSDPGADPRILRLSIGVEDVKILKDDLRNSFQGLGA